MKIEVETLFHKLVDLPPQARTQYFVDHHVDEDTRRQVEALLAFDAEANTFLVRQIGIARFAYYTN